MLNTRPVLQQGSGSYACSSSVLGWVGMSWLRCSTKRLHVQVSAHLNCRQAPLLIMWWSSALRCAKLAAEFTLYSIGSTSLLLQRFWSPYLQTTSGVIMV